MRLLIAVIAALLAVPAVVPAAASPAEPSSVGAQALAPVLATAAPTVDRIAGADRYATSVAISAHQFPSPSAVSAVYLARGDQYADALAAGVLADGPVLLVPSCGGVPASVAAEIARLDPATVVALGGTGALCAATLDQAGAGRSTDRLSGDTRQGTAAAIAARVFPTGAGRVYLVRGADNPDALAAGMLRDGPIVLASNDGASLPPETVAAIAALNPAQVVALGGIGSVSAAALSSAGTGRSVARVAGANRYETATLIAARAYPGTPNRVYLARGDGTNFADAVASGSLTGGPVVLVSGPCNPLPAATRGYLFAAGPARLTALGGTGAICNSILTQARDAVFPPPPPPPPARPDCSRLACVALTFDDGPSAHTGRLLDTLAARGVAATFFPVGQPVDARPLTARRAHNEGHSVENHTYSHPQLTTLSLSGQQAQVDSADSALSRAGVPRSMLLRPPYGSWDANTRRLGKPLILWSVDPRDWDDRTAAQIRSHIATNTRSGAIVLMHDSVSATVDAVPGIITDLRARGFTLVLVEDLIPNLRPGDVAYSRTEVSRAQTPFDQRQGTLESPDGRDLGPVIDEAPFVPESGTTGG